MFFPSLVAQEIDLGDDADVVLRAGFYDLFYFRVGECEAVDQFRMGFELVMIVHQQEQGVDLTWRQLFVYKANEGIEAVGAGQVDTETADRHHAVQWALGMRCLRICQEKGEGDKGGKQLGSHTAKVQICCYSVFIPSVMPLSGS